MQDFINKMHPIYLQSDCSGAEGAFLSLLKMAPYKSKLMSSSLAWFVWPYLQNR